MGLNRTVDEPSAPPVKEFSQQRGAVEREEVEPKRLEEVEEEQDRPCKRVEHQELEHETAKLLLPREP